MVKFIFKTKTNLLAKDKKKPGDPREGQPTPTPTQIDPNQPQHGSNMSSSRPGSSGARTKLVKEITSLAKDRISPPHTPVNDVADNQRVNEPPEGFGGMGDQEGRELGYQVPDAPRRLYDNLPCCGAFGDHNDSTFSLVNKRMGKKVFFRFSKEKSLFLFSFTNPIRRFCIRLICTQWFDHFIISIILINCVLLAANFENQNVEYAFAIIYTFEMILKVLARGFVLHKHAYLRDPWNRLDFIVVLFGYLTLIDELKELSFIKALRVLRSLRTITVVPGLRIMVNSLLKSLKNLSDVMLLTIFFLAVFAIIGLQLFMGQLKNRCIRNPDVDDPTFAWWSKDWNRDKLLFSLEEAQARESWVDNSSNWMPDQEDPIICGTTGTPGTRQCPLGSRCEQTDKNPNEGYTSFDDFGMAMLTCAQLITLDFWEDVYGKVLGSCGAYYIVYFLFIIFFGSFYLINLVLAVVAISYEQEVLSPQEEKTGLPKLDDDGDECSFVEEDEGGQDDPEDASHHGSGELTKERGFCGALRACCCCCCLEPIPEKGTMVLDPENGTMMTINPAARKETCCDKFMDVWTWFRSHIQSFIFSFWFENGIMLCIVVNTLCLALDSPGIGKDLDEVLSKINDCLTWIFTTELVIKLVGLLPTEFWKTKWNIFDTIIVVVSLVELNLGTSTSFNVSGLRSLRVLRVFRLAKSWSTMKALIDIIAESISGLVYLSIILGVVIYTLSVIGMNLFSSEYAEVYNVTLGEMPRWNYQDFYHSFILLFRILCGEWIELLYETLNATRGILWPVIFYLGALVLGNFLVLNLFLALLLNAFGEESIKEKSGAAQVLNDGRPSLTTKIKNRLFNIRKKKHKLASEIRMSSLALSPAEHMKSQCDLRGQPNGNPSDVEGSNNNNNNNNHNNNKADNDHDGEEYMSSIDEHEGHDRYSCDDCCQCCMICCRPFCVCCSRFRAAVRRVVEHRAFEWTILFLIMASSLTLAFEDITLEKAPVRKQIVDTLNYFYVVVFTIEMCLKLFAFGLVTYFESAWHWIDSLVVAISIVSIVIKNVGVSGLKAIRALRALRPLRAISQWEGMRLSVNALISSIPSFGNVSLVCLVLWLVFCILGVQFFGNKFYKCIVNGAPSDPEEVKNKTICVALYGEEAWQNSKINFDNTVMAFFALYQVATFEGWMEVMDDAVDSVGIDQQPVFENSFVAYVFFLVFIFVGSFFTLNLLVGVIIDNFNRLKKEYEEKGQLGVLLTPAQRRWMSTFRKMAKTKPIRMVTRPTNKFMKFCYDMSENQKFEVVITIIILLNMVQMSMEHDNAGEEFKEAMVYANYVFTVIYTLEAILKIIGTRKFYFYKSWNIFDFVIVVFAWLGVAMDKIVDNSVIDPSILRSFRVFRVARILRIIQMAKGIRRLLYTLICSLPALINIGTLLLLIIYIYAVVGVAMFGYVRRQGVLNDQVNFEQTPAAIVLMTRLATSAGWNDVLDAIMVQKPDCDPHLYEDMGQSGDCGFKAFAIAYFSSFVLIAFLIMINMYIAVILDNFSEAQQADEIGIDEDDINLFYEKWKVFDPKASQFLNVSKLRDLVGQLSHPLGIPEVTEDDILQLDIPLYPSDRAHCIDVLQALISRTLGPENNTTDEFDMIKELMAESFRAAFPTLAAEVVETTTKQRLREIRAAIVLQKAFRRFKNYKRNEALEGNPPNKPGPSSPISASHPTV